MEGVDGSGSGSGINSSSRQGSLTSAAPLAMQQHDSKYQAAALQQPQRRPVKNRYGRREGRRSREREGKGPRAQQQQQQLAQLHCRWLQEHQCVRFFCSLPLVYLEVVLLPPTPRPHHSLSHSLTQCVSPSASASACPVPLLLCCAVLQCDPD